MNCSKVRLLSATTSVNTNDELSHQCCMAMQCLEYINMFNTWMKDTAFALSKLHGLLT